MLLRNYVKVIEKIQVDLFFDDETEKHVELGVGDIIHIEYSDAGFRREIDGRIVTINPKKATTQVPTTYPPTGKVPMCPNKTVGHLVIDGSGVFEGQKAIVYFETILDCSIIEKYEQSLIVRSSKKGTITNIRVMEGILQVSMDNGLSYVELNKLLGIDLSKVLSDIEDLKERVEVLENP